MLVATSMLAVAGCDTEPQFRSSDVSAPEKDVPGDPDHHPNVGDRFVHFEDELLAEKFDPDALYVTVEESLGDAVVSQAKELTKNYAGIDNPKSHAAAVQRLVRDSLEADVVVVAKVVKKYQDNRPGYAGEWLPWTVYEFDVTEVLRGDDGATNTFSLERLGGTIDDTTIQACAGPDFVVEHVYYLPLARSEDLKKVFLLNNESAWTLSAGVVDGPDLAVETIKIMLEAFQ